MTAQPLTIIATVLASPGHEDVLRDAYAGLVAESLQEPGCLRIELHQSLDDPSILVFVETWAREEDWNAHMEGEVMARFQAKGAGKLMRDFVLYRMAQVSA